jgi:hypothetical protein
MNPPSQTSGMALAAFTCCLFSLASAVLAIVSRFDLFLIGIPIGLLLSVLCGILGLRDIAKSAGALRGKSLAKWGIALPFAGMGLGFCLLPAV